MNLFPDNDIRHWLKMAYEFAAKSPDPSTQNGAVIVSRTGVPIGYGFNRFATGLIDTPERLADRAQKYPRTVHAEVTSIWSAIRNGYAKHLPDATMFIAWYACDRCAIDIIESGIRHIIGHRQHPGALHQHSKWAPLVATGLDMLKEAGVVCEYFDDGGVPIYGQPIRLDYKEWVP